MRVVCGAVFMFTASVLLCTSSCRSGETGPAGMPARPGAALEQCNVVWDSPSGDSSGSMPIGNGDIGLNVWVEDNGDLLLLISKTDSWDQNYDLLKLGRVRVTLSPSPFAKGGTFRQELKLREGCIDISGGEGDKAVTLRVWVDANRPVIHVQASGESASDMTVRLEPWRTETRTLTDTVFKSNRDVETAESGTVVPDVLVEDGPGRVTWYHRNETSVWPVGMRLQGMESVMGQFADPLLNRTFGAAILGDGLARKDLTTLQSDTASKIHEVCICPLTAQTPTADAWREQLAALATKARAVDSVTALAEHEAWWRAFWDRSWIRISGDADAAVVTQIGRASCRERV